MEQKQETGKETEAVITTLEKRLPEVNGDETQREKM